MHPYNPQTAEQALDLVPDEMAPSVPRIAEYKARAVCAWLQEKFDIKRPPIATARLLVLVVELHRRHLPFPTRRVVAEACGMGVFGLDAALSVATARGLITLRMDVAPGSVVRRESVIKIKRYLPSRELEAAVDAAK